MGKSKCSVDLYSSFLLCSQTNFTGTFLSQIHPQVSHDSVTRWLSSTKLTPKILWEKVEPLVDKDKGILVLDDSLLAKNYSSEIAIAKFGYSGNYHRVIRGISLVTLLWTGGEEHIPVDFRIAAKDEDGKTKNQHFQEMVILSTHRGIKPNYVVFDTWYASVKNLKTIQQLGLTFVTWLRPDRIVDYGEHIADKQIPEEGLVVHLRAVGFIKVFKTVSKEGDVEYLATNKLDAEFSDIKTVAAQRWRVEEYHRGLKQTVGIEKCQARSSRSQRTHIFCSLLSFVILEVERIKTGISWYEQKRSIITTAMGQHLAKRVFSFNFSYTA